MRREVLLWGILAVPLWGGVVAARVAREPAVVLDGLNPGPIDAFGGELFVVRGVEVLGIDGSANVRVVSDGIPTGVSAITWDPAERLCWASGPTLACKDLLSTSIVEVDLGSAIRDVQLACDGTVVLLGEPASIIHLAADGAQTRWSVDPAIRGLARGKDCASVGAWSAEELGDVRLADGRFHTEWGTSDVGDAARSDGEWLVRRGDRLLRVGGVPETTVGTVQKAVAVGSGAPSGVVDAEGRLWLLP